MIEICEMTAQDIDAVYDTECKCFDDAYPKASFERELTNKISYYAVAKVNGKIVGYAGIWTIVDEAEVISIAVSPDFQRNGTGSALMEHIIKRCGKSGVSAIRLEVRQSNLAAQRLYEKFGFTPYGVRKKYYGGTEDAVLMIRTADGKAEQHNENISD